MLSLLRRWPRLAPSQAGNRPSITVAVQNILNTNMLDTMRGQSNVGTRIFASLWNRLINTNLRGNLEAIPGLATEWRRIDDQTVEVTLRQGVKLHNGDELTADDVVFSASRERMFGDTEPKSRTTLRTLETLAAASLHACACLDGARPRATMCCLG